MKLARITLNSQSITFYYATTVQSPNEQTQPLMTTLIFSVGMLHRVELLFGINKKLNHTNIILHRNSNQGKS